MANQVEIKFPCPDHGTEYAKTIKEDRSTIIVCYAPRIIKYKEVDSYTGKVIEKERESRCWHHMSGYNVKKKTKMCADCDEVERVTGSSYCRNCKNRRQVEQRKLKHEKFIEYGRRYRERKKRRVA